MSTFNTRARPECMLQNQRLLLEVLCDIRHCLVELLFRTSWLKKAEPQKGMKIPEKDTWVGAGEGKVLSRREEKSLDFKDRVKVISKRAKEKETPTEEDVEAF